MHHIYEGRWLKDKRYMDSYIDYLYNNGGNDRRYSESIADAAYARYLVDADSAFVMDFLDSMKNNYNRWSDHWDAAKNLYYIPAMPDATEYTIASIDASGGKDGFEGGEAFRPTINSYMYGNALAIARIASMRGDTLSSHEFLKKASLLRAMVEQNLWNDSLEHFIDRFKVSNEFVKYWDFIRGRELAGMIPWYFNLPSDDKKFQQAWKHVTDTSQNYLAYLDCEPMNLRTSIISGSSFSLKENGAANGMVQAGLTRPARYLPEWPIYLITMISTLSLHPTI